MRRIIVEQKGMFTGTYTVEQLTERVDVMEFQKELLEEICCLGIDKCAELLVNLLFGQKMFRIEDCLEKDTLCKLVYDNQIFYENGIELAEEEEEGEKDLFKISVGKQFNIEEIKLNNNSSIDLGGELQGIGISTRDDYETERMITKYEYRLPDLDECENSECRYLDIPELIQVVVSADSQRDNLSSHFTTTGDNPVTQDMSITNENNRKELEPDCIFYSDPNFSWPIRFYTVARPNKNQLRNFHKWVGSIYSANKDKDIKRLQAGRKKFWKKYFDFKKLNQLSDWMFKYQISIIANYFDTCLGIKK